MDDDTRNDHQPEVMATSSASPPPQFIAVEANLLRLPLFALHTQGLRILDGFECRGSLTRDGQTGEFVFRTARSTATLYPGPLSRSVHSEFLSMISERGLPVQNPITWSWHSLCQRLRVTKSGQMVRRLKEAIEATAGLTIYSQNALYSKPDAQPLQTRQATHLYDTVVFVNQPLPDGTIADVNHLWLSTWYLDNLNSLFTAPLDHELWRHLDNQSPIASRLYELLLINLHGGTPQLRIGYPRLAQFLPVRPERYLSDARKQLDPALDLLAATKITGHVNWQKRKEQIAILTLDRGRRLDGPSLHKSRGLDQRAADVQPSVAVRAIRRPPEFELVDLFYRLWVGRPATRPNRKELDFARQLLARHGRGPLKAALPLVIDQLKLHWPSAKTFLSIDSYLDPALRQHQLQQQLSRKKREERENERRERDESARQAAERHQFESQWLPVWQTTSKPERQQIERVLIEDNPVLKHMPHVLRSRCLDELARRRTGDASQPLAG